MEILILNDTTFTEQWVYKMKFKPIKHVFKVRVEQLEQPSSPIFPVVVGKNTYKENHLDDFYSRNDFYSRTIEDFHHCIRSTINGYDFTNLISTKVEFKDA